MGKFRNFTSVGMINQKSLRSGRVIRLTLRYAFPSFSVKIQKRKAIPVTGYGGPLVCDTSRLPHSVDNRLTDGGNVVSLTRRPPFTPRKIPGTHFC
jgi:hypothetical protein